MLGFGAINYLKWLGAVLWFCRIFFGDHVMKLDRCFSGFTANDLCLKSCQPRNSLSTSAS